MRYNLSIILILGTAGLALAACEKTSSQFSRLMIGRSMLPGTGSPCVAGGGFLSSDCRITAEEDGGLRVNAFAGVNRSAP